MSEHYYKLPNNLDEDIANYTEELQKFLHGELSCDSFKAKRVPRGVYEQRRNGTYMVRIRIAGGTLDTEQIQGIAEQSKKCGDSLLHVTSRQDIQLHDVAIEDTPGIMRNLADYGLTTKGGGGNTVRNVTACPYAGICPNERFDVTRFAHAVTEYLISLPESYTLPRKYKIAFSGCPADCAFAKVADLGLIAEIRDGKPGFKVYAGGGMGARSRLADLFLEWIPSSEAVRTAEAMRRVFDEHGDRNNKHRARLRFVFNELGVDKVRNNFEQKLEQVTEERVPKCAVNTHTLNDSKGGTANNNATFQSMFKNENGLPCFPQKQDGFTAIPIHLPMGFIRAEDFKKLGEAARNLTDQGELRTMRSQNLMLPYVKNDSLSQVSRHLNNLTTNVLPPTSLTRFVVCAGASTCRLGLCLSRNAAKACAKTLDAENSISQETLDAVDVHINGCPNSCGHQPVAPIGLYGAAKRVGERYLPMYRLTLGGRSNAVCARFGDAIGQIPAQAVAEAIRDLVKDFEENRCKGEKYINYYDRTEVSYFKKLIEPHTEIPDYKEKPSFYRDVGVDEEFSLAGRTAGECGAEFTEVVTGEDTVSGDKLDLRGVPCPMNFVQTKLKLESMEKSVPLEVILDDGEPIKNVSASLENEGWEMIDQIQLNDGTWQIKVQNPHWDK